MPLILETPPAIAPVTLVEAKEHMHVTTDDDDVLIGDLIGTATERYDGRDGALGRCLITQGWKLTLDGFPPKIAIPLPPCQSIDAITYVDPVGVTQTLEPADYQVSGLDAIEGARIRPAFEKTWPETLSIAEAVTVRFTAGYGDTASDVPEPIRAAIKLRVGHLYENRESTFAEDDVSILPYGETDLTRNHKTWSF